MGTVYACSGSCQGVVTEEQFKGGKNVCATDGCEKHSQPLQRRVQCDSCAESTSKDWAAHVCENCTIDE